MKKILDFNDFHPLISSVSPYPLFEKVAILVNGRSWLLRLWVLPFVLLAIGASAFACPFCTAVKPSLAERRDEAEIAAIGELSDAARGGRRYRLQRTFKGAELLSGKTTLELPPDELAEPAAGAALKPGSLMLLLAKRDAFAGGGKLAWSETPLDELSYAYVVRAPAWRKPAAERLAYFIPYLEHRNPLAAEDAYREFGLARFNEVAAVADKLPMDSLRMWLESDRVPQERKGFYGLALALARDPAERRRNAEFLLRQIDKPASDFRAGFDGVLGGYLLLAGEPGLERIERKYLADPQAASGDVRHAMTALRFYREYGREIPADRVAAAMRRLLAREEFAAEAVVDLARWQDWPSTAAVVEVCRRLGAEDASLRRAAIGFFLLSPAAEASRELSQLRRQHPLDVAEIERRLKPLDRTK